MALRAVEAFETSIERASYETVHRGSFEADGVRSSPDLVTPTPFRVGRKRMKSEERVRFLLRAAGRAEGDGNFRVASVLRRMARDVRPLELSFER